MAPPTRVPNQNKYVLCPPLSIICAKFLGAGNSKLSNTPRAHTRMQNLNFFSGGEGGFKKDNPRTKHLKNSLLYWIQIFATVELSIKY